MEIFSFDLNTDDIEEYIQNVCEASKLLGHGDNVVLNLLKATMPTELYGTLYGHGNLYVIMTMLKDIYAKKPQSAAAAATAGVAQGASAPFTLICSPTRDTPKAQSDDILGRQNITANRDSVPHGSEWKAYLKAF